MRRHEHLASLAGVLRGGGNGLATTRRQFGHCLRQLNHWDRGMPAGLVPASPEATEPDPVSTSHRL